MSVWECQAQQQLCSSLSWSWQLLALKQEQWQLHQRTQQQLRLQLCEQLYWQLLQPLRLPVLTLLEQLLEKLQSPLLKLLGQLLNKQPQQLLGKLDVQLLRLCAIRLGHSA